LEEKKIAGFARVPIIMSREEGVWEKAGRVGRAELATLGSTYLPTDRPVCQHTKQARLGSATSNSAIQQFRRHTHTQPLSTVQVRRSKRQFNHRQKTKSLCMIIFFFILFCFCSANAMQLDAGVVLYCTVLYCT